MDTNRIQSAAAKMGPDQSLAWWHQGARKAALGELGEVMAWHRAKAMLPELRETLALAEQGVEEAQADLKSKQAVLPGLEQAVTAAQKEMAQVEKRRQEDRALSAIPMMQGGIYPDERPVHRPTVSPTLIAERLARSEVRVTEGRSHRAVEMGLEGAERDLRKAKDEVEFAERDLARVRKWTGTIQSKVSHFENLEKPETPTWTLFLEA